MATMGAVPLNADPQPYVDFAVSGNPGWGMSPNTTYNLPFCNITMPFAGNLFVSIEWCLWWQVRQYIGLNLYSSPYPTGASSWADMQDGPDRCDVTVYNTQSWTGLAQGTVVSVGIAIGIGSAGTSVASDAWIVHGRGYRT